MKRTVPLPTTERLHELFEYNPNTGALVRKINKARIKRGTRVTCSNAFGHIVLAVDTGKYLAHRIIWKMVTGKDPVDQIDHKDGNPQNNCWENLREANRGQNNANAKVRCTNTSGVKGVWWVASVGRWRASVQLDKRVHDLGYFSALEDAAIAVTLARNEIHGEFARVA